MTTARRTTSALCAIAMAFAFGCSSDDDSSTSTTSAPSATTTAAGGDTSTTAADSGSSSDSTNPGPATLANGKAPADKTITFNADSTFSPSTLTVKPGELFTFVAAQGAPVAAVTFNGSDTYTISGGLVESFTLTAPGTYHASEDISGAEVTITVAG